jgi:hypothetical protein
MKKDQEQPLVEPEIKEFTEEEKKEKLQYNDVPDSDAPSVNNDYPEQDTKHGELEPELDPIQPTVADKVAPDVSEGAKNSGASTNDLPLVQPGEVPHLYQQYEPEKPASPKELDMPLQAYGDNGKIVEEYKPKLPENAEETVIEPVNPENPLQPHEEATRTSK